MCVHMYTQQCVGKNKLDVSFGLTWNSPFKATPNFFNLRVIIEDDLRSTLQPEAQFIESRLKDGRRGI